MNRHCGRGPETWLRHQAYRGAIAASGAMAAALQPWLSGRAGFRSLPRRLLAEEPPTPSDLIHVLGGSYAGGTARVDHGIDLFHRGLAKRLLLTGSGWETDWAEQNRLRALEHGVPATAILVNSHPHSTSAEARALRRIVGAEGIHSVLLVTDPYHSARAAGVFRHTLRRAGVRVRSCPAPTPGYPPACWWMDPAARGRLVREAVRLFLAQATGRA